MMDENFYELLENKICGALANADDEQVRHFWCDGVLPGFDNEYTQKHVNDNRRIALTAFCGKDGQEKYELILIFGPKALSRYARGLDIADCIPDSDRRNWLDIDISKKLMWIQLD